MTVWSERVPIPPELLAVYTPEEFAEILRVELIQQLRQEELRRFGRTQWVADA